MLLARALYAVLRFFHASSAALLIVGGIAALVLIIHRKVCEHMLTDTQYQVPVGGLEVAHRPEWVSDSIVASLQQSYPYENSVSIFEGGLTENIGQVYAGHPWVERVRYVRKQFPNRIVIAVDLRRPVAAIEIKGRYVLVDREAVRLPGEYAKVPDLPLVLLPVVGVRGAAPLAGRVWDAPDVRCGIAVAMALAENGVPDGAPVMAIDVENTGGRRDKRESEIVLWMADMVPVEWGRAPVAGGFGELTVDRKLKNLQLVLLACPDLKGVSRVRIQYDSPTFVEAR